VKLRAPFKNGSAYFNGIEYSVKDGLLEIPEGLCGEAVGRGYKTLGNRVADRQAFFCSNKEYFAEQPDFSKISIDIHNFGRLENYRDTVVIVPCHTSQSYIPSLCSSMSGELCSLLLVVDGEGKYDFDIPQIVLDGNTGFAHACNVGVQYTDSKYVCFLNADVRVADGWLDGMLSVLEEDENIAIVGNRQIDDKGKIHSCGSVWSWKDLSFRHVLRDQVPDVQREWVMFREVDMITASCLLMRRDVFRKLGGFDEKYLLGYWEDSDLCMKARNAGYRIVFTPNSHIVHFCGHSKLGKHRFYERNKRLFLSRWVSNGLVDKFSYQRNQRTHNGRITACMIALNEEEYIQASIESVLPLVDRIIIVEGGNDYAIRAGLCSSDHRSTDNTIDIIHSLVDLYPDKITLIQDNWTDKTEQRNAYARELLDNDIMLLLDADEVFYEKGLWRLSCLMHEFEVVRPGFDLFWNNFQTVGTGVWDNFPQIKVVRWHDGYHYKDHNMLCDKGGNLVASLHRVCSIKEKLYAHYSWVKPLEKLRLKAAYYEQQTGAAERMTKNYIDKVFLPWRSSPKEIELKFGTHPFGGGGTARFAGSHPEPIARRVLDGIFNWEGVNE